jgi:hypothetical protein
MGQAFRDVRWFGGTRYHGQRPGVVVRASSPGRSLVRGTRYHDGSVLNPGQSLRWELKYFFYIFGGTQIRTYSTSNDSYCNMNKNSNYTCTAEGQRSRSRRNGRAVVAWGHRRSRTRVCAGGVGVAG